MSHIGEFELIGRISAVTNTPAGVTGIGDDCAVIPQKQGLDTLVTTDLLIERRHFLLEDVSPFYLGWKSAAVNISDIAAMGGRPTAAFLSIALPRPLADIPSDGSEGWTDGFIRGFNELCGRFGVTLLGGDTSASDDRLFINVTVLGECAHGRALKRSSALPGDVIYVSGTLGDSGAGLRLILERQGPERPVGLDAVFSVGGDSVRPVCSPLGGPGAKTAQNAPGRPIETQTGRTREEKLILRHYRPLPRVELGLTLADTPGVHAMMDISDGIGSDLRHILKASGLGATVDVGKLPLSEDLLSICAERDWDPIELATGGGEDYELLFTASPGTTAPAGCVAIGTIDAEPGLRWAGAGRDYQGFTHF